MSTSELPGDSFSFGTVNSLEAWGLRVIAADLLLPPKRARKREIPGRSGQYDYGARCWDERTLKLECQLLQPMTKSQFREVIYTLSKKARLRLWNEPDKYYIAELYDPDEVQDYYRESMREFDLEFTCEPFAYGETVTVPLEQGRNVLSYQGTAETPCVIILQNTSDTAVTNLTLTAIKRSD